MTRFAVQRCIGNTIEVLGMYEGKEKMLRALEELRCQYEGLPGVINGISGNLDKKGTFFPGQCIGYIDLSARHHLRMVSFSI